MLARSFKSASELWLSDKEHEALVGLLGMLERGELKHVDIDIKENSRAVAQPDAKEFKNLFNMFNTFGRSGCGTTGCMAGVCDIIYGTRFTQMFEAHFVEPTNYALSELFAPDCIDAEYWATITPERCAIALRNFLTDGRARWEEVEPRLTHLSGAD